jgi:hypothetical protein
VALPEILSAAANAVRSAVTARGPRGGDRRGPCVRKLIASQAVATHAILTHEARGTHRTRRSSSVDSPCTGSAPHAARRGGRTRGTRPGGARRRTERADRTHRGRENFRERRRGEPRWTRPRVLRRASSWRDAGISSAQGGAAHGPRGRSAARRREVVEERAGSGREGGGARGGRRTRGTRPTGTRGGRWWKNARNAAARSAWRGPPWRNARVAADRDAWRGGRRTRGTRPRGARRGARWRDARIARQQRRRGPLRQPWLLHVGDACRPFARPAFVPRDLAVRDDGAVVVTSWPV